MRLELRTCNPTLPAHTTPLLFVHGAWCAAWCWAEHFLPYLAEQGFTAHALSLRGHGNSDGRERLQWASIADYVADVEQIVSELGCSPVLVGHSMGGFVVQHYLAAHTSPAAVLMASAPHRGLSWRWMLQVGRANGLRLRDVFRMGNTGPVDPPPALARYLFAGYIPAEELRRYAALLQYESPRAFLDMLGGRLPRPGWVRTPMLVLAAADDHILSPAEMYGLAHAYTADLEVIPETGHVMMLDANWQRAADRILAWLQKRGVA